jgi:quercetin dioxygenase-like cupin family protein
MPLSLEIISTEVPARTQVFPLGRFDVFSVGDVEIGRAVYSPGWRWSEHVAPLVGAELCEVEHVGVVISGHAAVKMADGTERHMGPGDLFSIPPGHDSWVIGDEDYVSLHLVGSEQYARPRPASDK